MSQTPDKPLKSLEKAHEDDFFIRQNRDLAARLKAKLELNKAGVHDEMLVNQLVDSGFDGDTLRVLFFVPLLDVAWVDSAVGDEEKRVLFSLIEARGITKDSKAFNILSGWIQAKPSDSFYLTSKSLVNSLLDALKASNHDQEWMVSAATRVAEASGGLFGLGSKVSGEEKKLIERLSSVLKK